MQRSSVDLPLPDAPIRQTTWCRLTSRLMPRSTGLEPKVLWTSRELEKGHALPPRQVLRLLAPDQTVEPTGERDGDQQEQQRGHRVRRQCPLSSC